MANKDGDTASSFRDPAGFLFRRNGVLYRQVNKCFKSDFDLFLNTGLYNSLVKDGLLIPHETVSINTARNESEACCVIRPEPVPFISYPYEWCFSQLKAAALLTLKIQRRAVEYGLCLRDASAYNVQFTGTRPIFIDTLSFGCYREGKPWVAYRQFCQHFLVPLALMARIDVRLGQLMRIHIDGIPLDLGSRLLPGSSMLTFALLAHIHLHAKTQMRFSSSPARFNSGTMSRNGMLGLIDSLESAVLKMKWKPKNAAWANYYNETNYSVESMMHKKEIIAGFVESVRPETVWDIGANTGEFSRLISGKGRYIVAFEGDPSAAETHYSDATGRKDLSVLPLLQDFTNPSPGTGWENMERESLLERGPADMVLALAFIHHLAISNNTPLERCATMLHKMGRRAAVEFVPRNDSQVQRMLASREDIFQFFTERHFEETFGAFFHIIKKEPVRDSVRTIYFMEKK